MAILVIVALLAFYMAWNLGANDVANAMGTSVGSKAITLKQAIIMAGVLEFLGAVLFGQEVTSTLGTKIANPVLFATTPQTLVMGMISVLLSGGIWLQVATSRGLPISSSHAIVGAIAGFSWVSLGIEAIDWSSMGLITIGWMLTPIISGAISAGLYTLIRHWIFNQLHPLSQLQEWTPWLSTLLLSIFGVIVLPTITQPLSQFLLIERKLNIPPHDITLFITGIAAIALTLISWRQLANSQIDNQIQSLFAKFQVISACFVAFAHGSNDVGNAIAPLAVIYYINQQGKIPSHQLTIPFWIMLLGAVGIVAGLTVWGKKVITTIGENIISLEPSSGFCAELATAMTILLASRLGLPVSTSHALVGGVVGIGLVQNLQAIKLSTIQNIAAAWLITVPICAALSAMIFTIINRQ
ncbi:inorganic phosphate transporter [Dolichospermum circinale]|uniref:inorganic phosphate transporter n=1 Tax=Dolichospermum circinale TaxID=109265 RepID=UPI00054E5F6C|nr:inorganic phosphate transporter [Dolichospermum circinale]MDB9474531.1 inorganic phosphate transporter [Dolichospermum circinale CS-537/11]MDB9480263.1 inorganic phosphate transporter [Dolichospermum circinale CS-537/03]